MKIVHITNTISERGGGIAAAVANIARSQKNIGHDISIWVFSSGKKKLIEDISRGVYGDLISEIKVLSLKDLIGCLSIMLLGRKSLLGRELDSFDVLHRHGLWSPISLISFLINPKLKNYFLSPHGLLNREALKISNYKKYIFSFLIERLTFKKSTALILSSEHEAEEVLRFSWAIKKNISIIPNGVDDSFFEDQIIENRFIKLYEDQSAIKHQFLYLGAIERIKGIDLLLEAINEISDIFRNRGYQLLCVGDGNKKYKNQLLDFIKQHSLDDIIKFQSGVYGNERIKLYCESRFFISASHSENFGITIAESLVLGIPVIVSSALPWGGISSAKAGILVEPNLESIKKGIVTACDLPDIEYEECCRNAIKFSNKKFRWSAIGPLLIETYSSKIYIKG
ncbi:glycosyltransferase [Gammaproteobacteria bacterium]|nr:glycosyltransferase [Gammaproteobacteria bacterium]